MDHRIDGEAIKLAKQLDVEHALPTTRIEGDARLLKLAAWLDDMPKTHRFNLLLVNDGRCDIKHPCGTHACAMGSAPMVFPEYVRTVLQMKNTRYHASGIAIVSLRKHRDGTRTGIRGYESVASVLFGITQKTAEGLFGVRVGPYDDDTTTVKPMTGRDVRVVRNDDPMVVVRRIENYMADRYSN